MVNYARTNTSCTTIFLAEMFAVELTHQTKLHQTLPPFMLHINVDALIFSTKFMRITIHQKQSTNNFFGQKYNSHISK